MDARKLVFILITFLTFSVFANAKNQDYWFSRDKIAHFTASLSITLWSHSYFRFQRGFNFHKASKDAFFVGITIGFGKETYDCLSGLIFRKKGKFFSLKDFFYDVLGTSVGMGLIYALDKR